MVHQLRQSGNVFGHSLIRRMQDFVHTRRDCCGSQSAQTHNHTYKGNSQINKNNIHGEGYQPVAEEHAEVAEQRYGGLFLASLGGGSHDQSVHALTEPAKIEPGEHSANRKARAPQTIAKQSDQESGSQANQKGQPRDAPFCDGSRRKISRAYCHRRFLRAAGERRAHLHKSQYRQGRVEKPAWYEASGPGNNRETSRRLRLKRGRRAAPWRWRSGWKCLSLSHAWERLGRNFPAYCPKAYWASLVNGSGYNPAARVTNTATPRATACALVMTGRGASPGCLSQACTTVRK